MKINNIKKKVEKGLNKKSRKIKIKSDLFIWNESTNKDQLLIKIYIAFNNVSKEFYQYYFIWEIINNIFNQILIKNSIGIIENHKITHTFDLIINLNNNDINSIKKIMWITQNIFSLIKSQVNFKNFENILRKKFKGFILFEKSIESPEDFNKMIHSPFRYQFFYKLNRNRKSIKFNKKKCFQILEQLKNSKKIFMLSSLKPYSHTKNTTYVKMENILRSDNQTLVLNKNNFFKNLNHTKSDSNNFLFEKFNLKTFLKNESNFFLHGIKNEKYAFNEYLPLNYIEDLYINKNDTKINLNKTLTSKIFLNINNKAKIDKIFVKLLISDIKLKQSQKGIKTRIEYEILCIILKNRLAEVNREISNYNGGIIIKRENDNISIEIYCLSSMFQKVFTAIKYKIWYFLLGERFFPNLLSRDKLNKSIALLIKDKNYYQKKAELEALEVMKIYYNPNEPSFDNKLYFAKNYFKNNTKAFSNNFYKFRINQAYIEGCLRKEDLQGIIQEISRKSIKKKISEDFIKNNSRKLLNKKILKRDEIYFSNSTDYGEFFWVKSNKNDNSFVLIDSYFLEIKKNELKLYKLLSIIINQYLSEYFIEENFIGNSFKKVWIENINHKYYFLCIGVKGINKIKTRKNLEKFYFEINKKLKKINKREIRNIWKNQKYFLETFQKFARNNFYNLISGISNFEEMLQNISCDDLVKAFYKTFKRFARVLYISKENKNEKEISISKKDLFSNME